MDTKTKAKKGIKKEIIKDFIKAQKYLDKTGEYIIIELAINKRLQKLLNKYVVTTGFEELRGSTAKRYLIKSVLLNSGHWSNDIAYLFEEKLIDTGKTKIKIRNQSYVDGILRTINSMQGFIEEIIRLQQKVVLRVNYNTEIEVLK